MCVAITKSAYAIIKRLIQYTLLRILKLNLILFFCPKKILILDQVLHVTSVDKSYYTLGTLDVPFSTLLFGISVKKGTLLKKHIVKKRHRGCICCYGGVNVKIIS